MDDLTASYVYGHMVDIIAAGVEQQVARLYIAHRNHLSPGRLVPGTPARTYTEMGEYALGKSGTVRAACKACPSVHIWIAQELLGIRHHRIPGGRYHL